MSKKRTFSLELLKGSGPVAHLCNDPDAVLTSADETMLVETAAAHPRLVEFRGGPADDVVIINLETGWAELQPPLTCAVLRPAMQAQAALARATAAQRKGTKGKDVNGQMMKRLITDKDSAALLWTADSWARALGCSAAMVRKTSAWKKVCLPRQAEEEEQERRAEARIDSTPAPGIT
jgi:hypothetical protein